jgi:predicted Zn-dependent protease
VLQATLASQAVARVQLALAAYDPAAARPLLGEVVSLLGTNDVVAGLLTRTRQQEGELKHLGGLREALKTGALPRQRVKELLAFAERYANRDELAADVLVLLDSPGDLSLAQCLNGFWAAEALGNVRLMARAAAAASTVLPAGTAVVPVVQVTTACHAVNLRGEAFALLNALTVASPESPEAWLELAAWQCERGEEKEALRSVRQATKLGGDDIKKRAREDSRFAPVSNTWSFRWNTG